MRNYLEWVVSISTACYKIPESGERFASLLSAVPVVRVCRVRSGKAAHIRPANQVGRATYLNSWRRRKALLRESSINGGRAFVSTFVKRLRYFAKTSGKLLVRSCIYPLLASSQGY